MANNIQLAEKFLPVIDEIYKKQSLTARLLGANSEITFDGTNKAHVFEVDVPGFGNYSRQNGFPVGDVESGWETYELKRDRGISLTVDAMDDEETLGMAFGKTVSEFMRTKEIPEIDAYRFAAFASATGVDGVSADITVGTTDVPDLIDAAEESMGDNEVPEEGRLLYVSEKCYRALKNKITRILVNENNVQRQVEIYDGMPIIRVPKSRFNTAITLYDGTDKFGYAVTPGGYAINFMIIHPSAVRPLVKHRVPRIWTPTENQSADAYKFDLRCYHDAFVLQNKAKGVYVHKANTANA